MTETKPIRFMPNSAAADASGDRGGEPTLATQFSRVSTRLAALAPPEGAMASIAALREFLLLADNLDSTYGADATLPIADLEEATAIIMGDIGRIESWLTTYAQQHSIDDFDPITLGLALWVMRHRIPIRTCEPLVNALARRANAATSRQETAATYAIAQGLIEHVAPLLAADLERSNPDRPWRVLNINFAITAIRTGDTALMRFAFDQLNTAIPAESAGFYTEALVLANQPGFPAEARELIAHECRRVSPTH